MIPLKQSQTAQHLVFLMVDSADHITGKTGLSPTVTLSKNAAAFGAAAGAITEISSGWYKVAGNATDTGTLGPLALHATATGADPTDTLFVVVAYDPQDTVRLGLTALPNAVPDAAGGLPVTGSQLTAIPAIATVTTLTNLPSIPANWLTAAGIAASALNGKGDWNIGKTGYALSAAGVQAIWDALTSALTTVGSIGKLLVDNINATISSRSTYAGGDTAGTTTLLSRIASALTITTGKVDVNDKTGFSLVNGSIAAATFAAGALDAVWSTATRALTDKLGFKLASDGLALVTAWTVAITGSLSGAVGSIATGGIVAASFAAGALDAVWSTAARLLTAGTNIVLAKGVGVTGFNDPTAAATATAVRTELTTELARVDVAISTRLATAGYTAPDNAGIAAVPTANANADALLDRANGIETGLTLRQWMRAAGAVLIGKLSGGGTITNTFRNAVADSKDRVTATVDTNGNRSAITIDTT